jgi:hypothetical protein
VTRALKAVLIVASIMRPGEGARQAPRVKPLVEPIVLRWINFLSRRSPPDAARGRPGFGRSRSSDINSMDGMAAMRGI